MAAGRAGAAARQKRLLEQLQAAKESLRAGDDMSAPLALAMFSTVGYTVLSDV